jgi:hypothetical protein
MASRAIGEQEMPAAASIDNAPDIEPPCLEDMGAVAGRQGFAAASRSRKASSELPKDRPRLQDER